MKYLLATCLLILASTGLAQEKLPAPESPAAQQRPLTVDQLVAKAQQAYEQKDYDGYLSYLQKLYSHRPYSGEVMYQLAKAYALNENPKQAFSMLMTLQKQGLAFDLEVDADFANIAKYDLFEFLSKYLASNGEPFNQAPVAFTLDEKGLLAEGIAFDGEAFYVGSVRRGGVWRTTKDGDATLFIEPGTEGMKGVIGLAVDRARNALWVTSNSVPRYEGFDPAGGTQALLYRFSLDDGDFEAKFEIAEDKLNHVLGNVTVAPDGSVYVVDSLSRLIYRLKPKGEVLQPYIGSARMTSLQGLEVTPDGKYLFVTDYLKGLFRIDLETGTVYKMGHKPGINLGGINDLAFYQDSLIAVQSGTQPPRIVRYDLTDDLKGVVSQHPLSANQPQYEGLGQGVLAGEYLYFIANTQRSLYGQGGKVADEGALEPVKILKADPNLMEKRREEAGIAEEMATEKAGPQTNPNKRR